MSNACSHGAQYAAGINCGVLLIRNTDWAREFFADVGQYAYMPKEELMSTMRPVRTGLPLSLPSNERMRLAVRE